MGIVGAAKVEALKGALATTTKEAEANKVAAYKAAKELEEEQATHRNVRCAWEKSSRSSRTPSQVVSP